MRWHSRPNEATQGFDMQARDFDELAGRIEGIGQAVLHLAAVLEMQAVIDGPQLSQAWRAAQRPNALPVLEAARHTLNEMAQALDDARKCRLSRAHR